MQYLSFAELCEIIKAKIEEKEDELIYHAYLATVCNALTGLSFVEFKTNIENNRPSVNLIINTQVAAEDREKKIEHYIDDYVWEEV